MINGTEDPLVKFRSAVVGANHGRSEPLPEVVKFWHRQVCGNNARPFITRAVPDRDNSDDSTASAQAKVPAARS